MENPKTIIISIVLILLVAFTFVLASNMSTQKFVPLSSEHPVESTVDRNMGWDGGNMKRIPIDGGVGMIFKDRYQLENGIGVMDGVLLLNVKSTGPTLTRACRVFIMKTEEGTKAVLQSGANGASVNNLSAFPKLVSDMVDAYKTDDLINGNVVMNPDPRSFVDLLVDQKGGVDYDIENMPHPEILKKYLR